MRKYSLSVRAAALLCAVCLLLTGCGQVASPDDSGDSGAPAPTAEPAAEETKLTIEDLGLNAEMKAAQDERKAAQEAVQAAQEKEKAAQAAHRGGRKKRRVSPR